MADRKTSGNSSGRPDSSGGSRKYSYNKTSGRATAAKGKSEDNGKSSSGKSKAPQFEIKKSIFDPEYDGPALFVVPIVLVVFALLTSLSVFFEDGAMGFIGGAFGRFLKGLFGIGAFLIPAYAVIFAIQFRKLVREDELLSRVFVAIGSFVAFDLLAHIFFGKNTEFGSFYSDGKELRGGGIVGSGLGKPLYSLLKLGLPIIVIAALVVLIPMLFGLTPVEVWKWIKSRIDRAKAERAERMAEDEPPKRAYGSRQTSRPSGQLSLIGRGEGDDASPSRRGRGVIDVDADPDTALAPDKREEAGHSATLPGAEKIDVYDESDDDGGRRPSAHEIVSPEEFTGERPERIKLSDMFGDSEDEALVRSLREKYGDSSEESAGDVDLEVKRRRVTSIPSEVVPPEPEKKDSAFAPPPLTLLREDPGKHDPNVAREVEQNAERLTAALDEFNVRASILNTMHGPTVTRYELGLDTGVRVKSIISLSDDISYSLAAQGSIRIEAPIPGKSAVGIEVPNKTRETVYLRTLIESPDFRTDKPLRVALGEDVGGEGVYCDLSKMPHLLIAGTTGSGKSVCINTIIISILYRNAPDEVKLILIDPKHVEFAPYEGMPHLLVPVVSDMKKAAGALQWAVSEMERRYGMLESARVRDITAYSKLAASSKEPMEPMPRIVIIIDELAELMMQARDSVEPSICRIAQKARAAGMHLIIGTQRPDVSVVTGLIKANIPSRIALTVKSQVDSRTMIDKAGAEKLLGNGDMLFNPIGIPEPKRVQGAFVSDEEIAAVVEYLKAQGAPDETSSEEILAEIEREAIKCENPKKGGASSALSAPGDDGGDEDPMLMDALELAVESGKISTSLIQRRLSLGYGRAAKLIDRMQQLGYVSAPDGQKPRDVLITPEQFLELKLKD